MRATGCTEVAPGHGAPTTALPRPAGTTGRALYLAGSLGLLAVAIWLAASSGSGIYLLDTADVHYVALATAAVAACGIGVRRSRGPARRVWLLFGAATLLNATGDIAFIVVEAMGDTPWVSSIDVVYLASYPLLLAGLWVIARARNPAEGAKAMLDGLVLALSLGLLTWELVLVAPGGMADADTLWSRIVLAAYPFLDLLLLGAVAGVLLVPGRRTRAMWTVAGFVVVYFAADISYAVLSYTNEAALLWIDVGYLAAFLLLGLAALSADAPRIADPQPPQRPGLGRFVLLAGAAVTPGFAAAVTMTVTGGVNPWVFVATSLAVAAVLSVRVASLMRTEHLARHDAEDMREQLDRRAHLDELTGLPNRHALVAALRDLPPDTPSGLLLIDLDRFKAVNDTGGHRSGDAVLREASRRIRSAVREGDVVHRLGGDEFVVLCPGVDESEEAERIAARILDTMAPAFRVDSMEWFVGASIGLAVARPGEFAEPEELVDASDIAMYEAKRDPVRSVARFDESMRHRLRNLHATELELRRALDEDRIEAAFQPIVRLDDGSVAGFETLARWRRPAGDLVSAAEFIPVAEQTGLVDEIDRRMVERATRFAKAFNEQNLDRAPAFVTVNLSPHHLGSDVAAMIDATIRRVGADPTDLVVELTESALGIDPDVAVRRLTAVRDLGVLLAIDDFGTGYSSLAQLLRFPVDFVKVDRLFVHSLGTVPAHRSGAAAALQVSDTLGIRSVAEGVETVAQAEALRSLGYTLAQGFLFGPPMTASEAARLGSAAPGVTQPRRGAAEAR